MNIKSFKSEYIVETTDRKGRSEAHSIRAFDADHAVAIANKRGLTVKNVTPPGDDRFGLLKTVSVK